MTKAFVFKQIKTEHILPVVQTNQFLQSISSKNSSLSIGKDVGPGFYRVSGSVLFVVASLGTKLLIGALGSQTFQNSVLLSNTTCGRGSDTY